MKILKFGGTSVGTPARMHSLLNIINPLQQQIIVLSAVSGTTNSLVAISDLLAQQLNTQAFDKINELKELYYKFAAELIIHPDYHNEAVDLVNNIFDLIYSLANNVFTAIEGKVIIAQGELLSTGLFYLYCLSQNHPAVLLPALSFMRINEDGEPDMEYLNKELSALLAQYPGVQLFITQGFICRNHFGEVDNLKRGGSDYTASLIGGAIQAQEIQIWTDIDGMHNNDPRIVTGTRPILQLSFTEAAELAYFGAKILHPQSVHPAQKYNVPVRLLNTMEPRAPGTLITGQSDNETIKSIAAKDNITAIRITSSRMLLAYGFLRQVFEVFERYKTPIDMITTSEVSVSVTIDDDTHLSQIAAELKAFGSVDVSSHQSIICVVGNFSSHSSGIVIRVVDALKHIPVHMISYGGSQYNVSLLVDTSNKTEALRSLHNRLF